MSVKKERALHTDAGIITCNGCGYVLNVHPGDNPGEIRQMARSAGWLTEAKVGKAIHDFCPRCFTPKPKPVQQVIEL